MSEVSQYLPTLERAVAEGVVDAGECASAEEQLLCGLVVKAKVIGEMFEVYVPRMMAQDPALHGFESAFEGAVTPAKALPPPALRCHDLRPQATGGGYRAVQGTKEPTFHGYGFADCIDQAEEDLKQFFLGQNARAREREAPPSGYEVLAFAWPLRWYRLATGDHVVIYVKRHGAMGVFRGEAVGA